MRRDHVASTLIRRHFDVVCLLGGLWKHTFVTLRLRLFSELKIPCPIATENSYFYVFTMQRFVFFKKLIVYKDICILYPSVFRGYLTETGRSHGPFKHYISCATDLKISCLQRNSNQPSQNSTSGTQNS